MDFMKVIDQTVREIKREVNLKVLKVPEIEQKVLDATDNEPWGPHGSALAEIANATKKFTDCPMVMNVLWTRLTETGRDWRHVYKALAVIEYLVANGSERAVDDIIEHTYQISSLSGFEYAEPNGKDMGINVRKKVETILSLLNDNNKIQEVRKKAAANREKYFGLSSSGITYKSSSTSHSSSNFQSTNRYGLGDAKEGDMFKDSYKGRDRYGEDNFGKDTYDKSHTGFADENQEGALKKGSVYNGRDQDALSSGASRLSANKNHADANYGPIPSQSSSAPPNNSEDDFDDFNPRGTSTPTPASANQVDLLGDFMDAPISVPADMATMSSDRADVDLFADATFVSALPPVAGTGSQPQAKVDLFASEPALSSAISSTVDLFASQDQVLLTETKPQNLDAMKPGSVDPFASVPLNNFDASDVFGDSTPHTDPVSTEPKQNSANGGNLHNLKEKSSTESKPAPKKDTFQVKSGIWADSLSRGLIDLNISAPKKVSLADIGIVGELSDGTDEKEKGHPTAGYMGRAMGGGSSLNRSGFTSSASGGDNIFSNFSQQQFGSFKM